MICRSVVFLWCKVDLFGWSWGCLDVGRRPWQREAWRSRAEPTSQVRAGSHGFAGDVAAGGWRSRGVSAGCEHRGSSLAQFLAVGGGGRGRRILLEGSVAVLPLLRVAPGENLIFGSDGGGYPWSYPSGRHRLGVLASSWSVSPPRWLQVVLRSSYLLAWLCPSGVMVLGTFVSSLGCVRCVSWWRVFVWLAQMYVMLFSL